MQRTPSSAIGRVLSARLYSGTAAFSPKIAAADAYLENAKNGAILVSIHGGHALDLAISVLGSLANVTALTTIQYPQIEVSDLTQARSIPDHLLVEAHLMNGGALSIEVAGGRPPEASRFCLEVTGDKGTLALDGGALRGFPTGRLRVSLNGEPQQVDDGETGSMLDTAANVVGIYAALRNNIAQGTSTTPDFDHAVRLARLVDDVLSSAQTETRQSAADCPLQS